MNHGQSSPSDAVLEAVTREISEQLAASRITSDMVVTAVLSTLSELVPGMWILVLMRRDPATSRVFAADRDQPQLVAYINSFASELYGPGIVETTGLTRQVIERGTPILKPRLSMDDFLLLATPKAQRYLVDHHPPVRAEWVSSVIVPMNTFGATIGTLGLFQFDPPEPLGEVDAAWMQRIADRTALAAEYADLHKIALEREARLAAISAVALMIASARELRPALDVLLEHLRGRLGVDAADVLVVDGVAPALVTASSAGFHSTSSPALRFEIPEQLSSSTQTADMNLIGYPLRRSLFMREGFQAYRVVPVRVQARLVGAIELFHRSPLHIDPDEIGFLEAMASLTALAIERSVDPQRGGRDHRGPPRRGPRPGISRRELDILKLLVAGHTNQKIAERLNVSSNTVKFHVRELLEKAQVSNRTELAALAIEGGWLEGAG